MWKVYLLMVTVVAIISYFWVRGIDYMKENHPDYKGYDLFDETDDSITKSAGRDGWDDNKIHTEQDFM